jgi:hypothetical protein
MIWGSSVCLSPPPAGSCPPQGHSHPPFPSCTPPNSPSMAVTPTAPCYPHCTLFPPTPSPGLVGTGGTPCPGPAPPCPLPCSPAAPGTAGQPGHGGRAGSHGPGRWLKLPWQAHFRGVLPWPGARPEPCGDQWSQSQGTPKSQPSCLEYSSLR